GLILSVFVLQNSDKILAATSEPARLVMLMPSLPPPAPAPAMAQAPSNSATPVIKTETPRPVKPELAPKVVPPNEPVKPQPTNNAAPTDNNLADELNGAGAFDGPSNGQVCGGSTGIVCGTALCGGSTGIPCGTDPKGTPGGDPNAEALPDEGGPVPLKSGMDAPKKITEQCALPEYPAQAKAAGLTGAVKLRITVSRTGKVEQMSVLDGPEIFQEAAKSYLQDCAFTPAMFNGHAISVTKLEIVNFTLR
ncbi:MAG: TonB family protein, partial [Verrucomicrobiales bacterium]